MSEENQDEKVQINGDGSEGDAGGEKRRVGRPRKEKALTPVPPNRAKKAPEDIKDPHAAIHRCYREMVAHVENLRQLHPESQCGDPVNPLDTVKAPGAPIKKSAFHAPLIGLCKVAGFVGDLEPEELPSQADYDRTAEAWADASTHLGLTERAAALFSAASETVSLVGFTVAKAVKKLVVGPARKPEEETTDRAPLSEKREREGDGENG